MRIGRVTIRGLTVVVAAIALMLWLGVTAHRLRQDEESQWLYHFWETKGGDIEGRGHVAPFWPRYWRRLLSRPWPGDYDCPCDGWQSRYGLAMSGIGEADGHTKDGKNSANDRLYKKFWNSYVKRFQERE